MGITRHMVTWIARGTQYSTPIVLEEGYTTEEDIPEMLALTKLHDVSRIGEIEVLEVKEIA